MCEHALDVQNGMTSMNDLYQFYHLNAVYLFLLCDNCELSQLEIHKVIYLKELSQKTSNIINIHQ